MSTLIALLTAWAIATGTTGDGSDIWEYQPEPEPARWHATETAPPAGLDKCVIVDVAWHLGGHSPIITNLTYLNIQQWEIRTDIVGTFLWTQFDKQQATDDIYDGTSSIPLKVGVERVEVCR